MEDVLEMGMLLDFYGQLLTSRQFELMDLHYNHDYSLAEISEQLDISRQGVYDGIKKAKGILMKLEERLRLVTKFASQKDNILESNRIIKEIRMMDANEILIGKLDELESCIDKILKAF